MQVLVVPSGVSVVSEESLASEGIFRVGLGLIVSHFKPAGGLQLGWESVSGLEIGMGM